MKTALANGSSFALNLPDGPETLNPTDVTVKYIAPEGWTGVVDRGTEVMIDTRITGELAEEGMAREVIRFVQDQRKKADLQMEDRIVLYLGTEAAKLAAAIATHKGYICRGMPGKRVGDAAAGAGSRDYFGKNRRTAIDDSAEKESC